MDNNRELQPPKSRAGRIAVFLRWAILVLVIGGSIAYYFLAEPIRRTLSQVELYYNILFVAQLYAEGHEGLYPPLADEPGLLMYAPETITADLITDIGVWFYPGEPGRRKISIEGKSGSELDYLIREYAADQSYYYFGFFITNDVEARAFANAYRERLARQDSFEHDLIVPEGEGNFGGDRLLRLRTREKLMEDVGLSEREALEFMDESVFLIQNPRKRSRAYFPPPNRTVANVLYASGFGRSCEIPGSFPCTSEFFETMESLDELTNSGPRARLDR